MYIIQWQAVCGGLEVDCEPDLEFYKALQISNKSQVLKIKKTPGKNLGPPFSILPENSNRVTLGTFSGHKN